MTDTLTKLHRAAADDEALSAAFSRDRPEFAHRLATTAALHREALATIRAETEALAVAREALTNHACHAGPKVPCRRSPEQCRWECGKDAGDALARIDAITGKGER